MHHIHIKPHTHTRSRQHIGNGKLGSFPQLLLIFHFIYKLLTGIFNRDSIGCLLNHVSLSFLTLSISRSAFILSPSVFMFGCFAHSKLLLCRVILSPFRPHLNIFLLLCMLLPFLLIFPLLFMMARHFLFFLCLFSSLFGLSLDYCVELFSVI